MKKFNQLLPNDFVFRVEKNKMNFTEIKVKSVDAENLNVDDFTKTISRSNGTEISIKTSRGYGYSTYTDHYLYFANQTEAIRYCKSQMMKNLFSLIDLAKESVEKIKKFRRENYELLNHEWTENEINKIEHQIKQ